MNEELAILGIDLAVDDDLRAGGVVVAVVVGGVLEEPLHLAGRRVESDRAVGEQVVARPVRGIVARRRVASAPIGEVGLRIVGAGHVERAAAGLPGVLLVLPGLAAGLAGGGDDEGLPLLLAGLGIEAGKPVAHAIVAAGGADHDCVLERERRGREFEVGLVAVLFVPDDLAGLRVGRDDAPVIAGDRDHEIAPQGNAAITVRSLLAGIHLPDDATK